MEEGWVNRSEYPFQPHYLPVDGGKMHYVDEGQGQPVVMVHGTPTWSFLYRHFIRGLAPDYRVLAPDHIGFGLSDKPAQWGYRPADHARNLASFIEQVGLRDLVLIVHDFGGPIGLSYALDHPDNVRALVICNTFLWSLKGDSNYELPNRLFNNPLGRFLYKRLNFSPVVLVRSSWGDKKTLTPEIHRHYTQAFPTPAQRQSTWTLLRELLGSSEWYESLWQRRDRIRHLPALLLWGMKDFAFKEKELARLASVFERPRVERLPDVGHFVPDEAGQRVLPLVRAFIAGTTAVIT